MKTILILLFSIYVLSAQAQTNDTANNNSNKPTWTEKIPERSDAPDMNTDFTPDTEIDLDMGDLGMDRSALFDEESTEEVVEQQIDVPQLDQNNDEDPAEQERLAEAARVAQSERDDQAQKDLEEKQLAERRQKELDDLAEQKRVADALAAEKLANENRAIQEAAAAEIAASASTNYNWKKIKNVLPDYPSKAARNKDEGWVSIRIEIDIYGDVIDAKVVDSYRKLKTFNSAAVKAVKQWKFDPPINYGIDIKQTKNVRIAFEL